MSASDNFLLSRPDHQTRLVRSILEEKEFHDVSLACEDKQVRAHKVILAAGSSKLRAILLQNPHPHPVIYLYGIKFSILENILQFIYHGEIAINRDQVKSFLAVAQELQVKGLTEPPGGDQTAADVSSGTRKDSTLGREENGAKMRKPPSSTATTVNTANTANTANTVNNANAVNTVTDGQYEGEYVESESEV